MHHSRAWTIAILLPVTAGVDSAIRPGEIWLRDLFPLCCETDWRTCLFEATLSAAPPC